MDFETFSFFLPLSLASQVAIPVASVRLVKKHKTAGLVPNGLVITTDSSQKVRFHRVQVIDRQIEIQSLVSICCGAAAKQWKCK